MPDEKPTPKHHDLKIDPLPFHAVRLGRKTFELRRNDRDYQSGDTVTLKEFDRAEYQRALEEGEPNEDAHGFAYTGDECGPFTIGHVLREGYGLPEGFVIFSLLPLPAPDRGETPETDAVDAALQELEDWKNAYPTSIFREPDWAKAAKVLEENGMTLDGLSAATLRDASARAYKIAAPILRRLRASSPVPPSGLPGEVIPQEVLHAITAIQIPISGVNWESEAKILAQYVMSNLASHLRSVPVRQEGVEEALTPSAETKAAYMGEFSFWEEVLDDEGARIGDRKITVPWTTIKDIMAAIRKRALRSGAGKEGV